MKDLAAPLMLLLIGLACLAAAARLLERAANKLDSFNARAGWDARNA